MKGLLKLASLCALFAAAGAAHAIPITDTVGFGSGRYMCPDVSDAGCNAAPGAASSVSWTHNLPAGSHVISYIIELDLFDDFFPFDPDSFDNDRGEPEFARFFQAGSESIPTSPPFEMRSPFEIDGFSGSPQVFQFAGSAAGLAMLNSTGMLPVRLNAVFNLVPGSAAQGVYGDDFFLSRSRLIAEIQDPTMPVPEPGTMSLLGLGLLAIGLTRRRRLNRQRIAR